jgi:hypothetical protein
MACQATPPAAPARRWPAGGPGQGRHHSYRLAGPAVAEAIESSACWPHIGRCAASGSPDAGRRRTSGGPGYDHLTVRSGGRNRRCCTARRVRSATATATSPSTVSSWSATWGELGRGPPQRRAFAGAAWTGASAARSSPARWARRCSGACSTWIGRHLSTDVGCPAGEGSHRNFYKTPAPLMVNAGSVLRRCQRRGG